MPSAASSSRSGPRAKPNASSIVAANGSTVLTADRLRISIRRSLAAIAWATRRLMTARPSGARWGVHLPPGGHRPSVTSRSTRCGGGASWLATTTVCPPACAAISRSSTTTRASTSNRRVRLVEQYQRGSAHEAPRECETLAHALREAARPNGGHLVEPDPFERGPDQARVKVVQAAGEAQVFGSGEIVVQARLMAQQIGPCPDGASLLLQIEAEHAAAAEGR